MDPEPRGCDAGGAVGKGYLFPLMIDTKPNVILTMSVSVLVSYFCHAGCRLPGELW